LSRPPEPAGKFTNRQTFVTARAKSFHRRDCTHFTQRLLNGYLLLSSPHIILGIIAVAAILLAIFAMDCAGEAVAMWLIPGTTMEYRLI
jgi:hypothetical protein